MNQDGVNLVSGPVRLRFVDVAPGIESRGIVPSHRFRVEVVGLDVGRLNVRARDTEHVILYAGHLGFAITEGHRGRGYARLACLAVIPFVAAIRDEVVLTCDPDNTPSIRTIEALGAIFLDTRDVPPHDPQYDRGSRRKRRYRWVLLPVG